MTKQIASMLDSTRLLFDLQRANESAQSFSGCSDPQAIAHCVTDGLVERFGCAFARIWLVESEVLCAWLLPRGYTLAPMARLPEFPWELIRSARLRKTESLF